MAHSIGLNLALNDVHPKLDTYLTWDTLRERARADYDQCEAVCLNGCKHAVTAVYIHEVVRRLNINPVVGDDHQYPSSLFSSLLEQVNKYCPESQILCDSRDTNCMDKVYACSHGFGHGFLQPWGDNRMPLFSIKQAQTLCLGLVGKTWQMKFGCKTGITMQAFRNSVDDLKMKNPGKTFEEMKAKVVQIMKDLCVYDDDCGSAAGEVVMYELNMNKVKSKEFCLAAYKIESNIEARPTSEEEMSKQYLISCYRHIIDENNIATTDKGGGKGASYCNDECHEFLCNANTTTEPSTSTKPTTSTISTTSTTSTTTSTTATTSTTTAPTTSSTATTAPTNAKATIVSTTAPSNINANNSTTTQQQHQVQDVTTQEHGLTNEESQTKLRIMSESMFIIIIVVTVMPAICLVCVAVACGSQIKAAASAAVVAGAAAVVNDPKPKYDHVNENDDFLDLNEGDIEIPTSRRVLKNKKKRKRNKKTNGRRKIDDDGL
jgi:hypothetical protein